MAVLWLSLAVLLAGGFRALRKPHYDYGLLNAINQIPAVRDALRQVGEMLRKRLK